jgi:hypothetical protein
VPVLPVLSPRPARGRRLAAAAVLALALPAAGCGGSGSGGDGGADPASVVPARAALYAEVTVRPEGDQAAAVDTLAKKIAGTDDLGAVIVEQLDKGLKKDGSSFKEDIEPWLGDKVAVTITGLRDPQKPDYAIVVAAKDTKKALASLKKGEKGLVERKYKDTSYTWNAEQQQAAAGVGDTLVIATEPALKSVIDVKQGGDALAGSDNHAKARKSVTSDRLGFLYVDPAALIDLAASSNPTLGAQAGQLKSLLGGAKASGIGAAVIAAADAIRVETVVDGQSGTAAPDGEAAKALAGLPSGSVAAIGLGQIGSQAQKGVDQLQQLGGVYASVVGQFKAITGLDLQQDVLSWMGNGGLFVRAKGLADIGGALVVDTSSEEKSSAFITSVERLITRFGGSSGVRVSAYRGSGTKGIRLQIERLPFPIVITTGAGKFAIAVGEGSLREALKPTSTLGDDAQFKATAAKLGVAPSVYVDLQAILGFADLAAKGDTGYADARRYLQAFTAVAAGAKRTGDTTKSSIVVGVK